jgi:hypothetical protein
MTALSSSARFVLDPVPFIFEQKCVAIAAPLQACFCKSSLEKWILLAPDQQDWSSYLPGRFFGQRTPRGPIPV